MLLDIYTMSTIVDNECAGSRERGFESLSVHTSLLFAILTSTVLTSRCSDESDTCRLGRMGGRINAHVDALADVLLLCCQEAINPGDWRCLTHVFVPLSTNRPTSMKQEFGRNHV
jgi:hypothetical protein